MVEKTYPATDESLAKLTALAEEIMDSNDVPMKVSMQVTVAIEEIFVNIAHYAYEDKEGDAKITIDLTDSKIAITFIDSGVPFNPLEKPDPDITLSADDRAIGGLGIYMVKKSMTDVDYKYENSQNILTITKEW
ncbi:MAG: ATP-binding protein [Firmicutes bacterium]|nr:ATP-binding protein [Candidatus Colimorpha enterica]